MWNNNLQTLLVGMTMAVGVSLTGCTSNNDAENQDASTDNSEQTVAAAPVEDSAVTEGDLDGATAQQGTPVTYDVSTWGSESVESVNVDELEAIQSSFGEVLSSDENSLDYASSPATKYRFMQTDAPYLDIVDSEKYLEFGWYYANPTDSDAEKEQSLNHAQKAYNVAQQLMGDEGGKLVADMLNGQIVKDKVLGGQQVELAKCEFYSCMLIINKAESQTDTDNS